MGTRALFLLTVAGAIPLMAPANSARADYVTLQGAMQVQSTVGPDCRNLGKNETINFVLREDAQSPRFDGYLTYGYPLIPIHVSGNDPEKLTVDLVQGTVTPHPAYTMRLQRSANAITGADFHATTSPAKLDQCFFDSARIQFQPVKGDAQKWFDQSAALFRIRLQAESAAPLLLQGRFPEALLIEQRALASAENAFGPDYWLVAPFLSVVGVLLLEPARYAESETMYRRALAIDEKAYGADSIVVAQDVNGLARVLGATGRFGEAETAYRRAIAIDEKALGSDSPVLASNLGDLALLIGHSGRLDEAEALGRRALAIDEKALGPDNISVAADLNVLVYALTKKHRYEEAASFGQRQLAIHQRIYGPDNSFVAQSLNNLGNVYREAGRYGEAEPLLRHALAITEKQGSSDNFRVGQILLNVAFVLRRLGRDDEALSDLKRAYRIAHATGTVTLLWSAPAELMNFYRQSDPPQSALAIFYGKEAVNELQRLRGSLSSSGAQAQEAFVGFADFNAVYRKLAALLVAQHRFAEAQQVLAMLKEREFYVFTGESPAANAPKTVASLTASEKELDDFSATAVRQGQEMAALQDKFQKQHQLSAAERARLTELRLQMDRLQENFDTRAVAVAKASSDAEGQRRRGQEINDYSRAFQGTLKAMGHNAVLAQYFILEDHVEILLTTPSVVVARQSTIMRDDLNRQIRAYRQTLSRPDQDPLPQAKALYQLLVAPIAEDLRQADAKTLMVSLDDTLRYLPFAALHDGRGYLIENLSVVMVNEAVRDKLVQAPNPRWSVWGMGVTQRQEGFEALPYVAVELNDIAGKNGVLAGKILLDKAFTEGSLRDGLDQAYPIIHIASHFQFTSGSMNDSFLLLGDGTRLTLAQIKTKLNFNGVELLTLSACETALGDNRVEHHGDEIEGLGAIAQEAGAKAVLATLWPVADQSTALLMSTLYRAHKDGHLDKADALRYAQWVLLHGTAAADGAASTGPRGLTRVDAPQASGPGAADHHHAPFAHPFFWAPFILMGNWL